MRPYGSSWSFDEMRSMTVRQGWCFFSRENRWNTAERRRLLVTRHIRFRRIPPDTQQGIVRDVTGERHRLPGWLWPDRLARPCTVPRQIVLLKRAIGVVHQRSNWQARVSS